MVMLDYMCAQSIMITHTHCFMLIVKYKVMQSSPETGCYWLRVYNISMTMIMLDYMCVQSLMTTHMTNNNL